MIKVFYSYAREDKQDVDLLIRRYTDRLARSGRIEHWLDRYLHAGDEWKRTIMERLEEADVIVLLLSADFFASEFISKVELPRALERRGDGTVEVIPVLLRQVLDEDLEHIGHLQIVPQNPIYDSPSNTMLGATSQRRSCMSWTSCPACSAIQRTLPKISVDVIRSSVVVSVDLR